jgi:hypothetical protein
MHVYMYTHLIRRYVGTLHMGHLLFTAGSAEAQELHIHICRHGYIATSFSSERHIAHSAPPVSPVREESPSTPEVVVVVLVVVVVVLVVVGSSYKGTSLGETVAMASDTSRTT